MHDKPTYDPGAGDPQPLYPSMMIGEWGGDPNAPPLPLWRWFLGFFGIEPPYRKGNRPT